MKGLIALLLALVLGLNVYNWWEIRTLRQEITLVRANLDKVEEEVRSQDLVSQAQQALELARAALGALDTPAAAAALETARKHLADAAAVASERARPALKWLEQQASELSKRLPEKTKQ